MKRCWHILLAAMLAVALPAAAAPTDEPPPGGPSAAAAGDAEEFVPEQRRRMREALEGVGVDERLGEQVDLAIPFVDHRGRAVTLADYLNGERPVVLVFVYHTCPMLCSIILNGLIETMRETRLRAGPDYRLVAVSIDPRDTPERAAAARERYLRQYGDGADDHSFAFLTGSASSIAALTAATGFRYEWVEARQEYAHAATAIFLTPTGTISRYLYGLRLPALDFRRAVIEAGQGTVGSPIDQVLLFCFVFDPDRGGYVLYAANAMRVGGLLTLVLLLGALLLFWRREALANLRRRRHDGRWSDYEDALRTAPDP